MALPTYRVKFLRDTRADLRDPSSEVPAVKSVSAGEVHIVSEDVFNDLAYCNAIVITNDPTKAEASAAPAKVAPVGKKNA